MGKWTAPGSVSFFWSCVLFPRRLGGRPRIGRSGAVLRSAQACSEGTVDGGRRGRQRRIPHKRFQVQTVRMEEPERLVRRRVATQCDAITHSGADAIPSEEHARGPAALL
jgi:hypothetical protein